MNTTLIKKYSGELVPFEVEKLEHSLFKSGASPELIAKITKEVRGCLFDGISTKEIYKRAYAILRKSSYALAGRYKLKKAIMELGPSGYPFEAFIAHLFQYQGYKVESGVKLEGKCVSHEVDVRAENDDEIHFMECKYHSNPGYKSDVKIALYVHSRVNDLIANYQPQFPNKKFKGWIVDNTNFTSDAIRFAECSGLKIMAWNYPDKGSLKDRIEISGLYPISCLITLTKAEKQSLLKEDIVLCQQLLDNEKALQLIDKRKHKKVLQECIELTLPLASQA
ncbi:ATP cone domain-containing protein [Roseivirga echinicomitans]